MSDDEFDGIMEVLDHWMGHNADDFDYERVFVPMSEIREHSGRAWRDGEIGDAVRSRRQFFWDRGIEASVEQHAGHMHVVLSALP